MDDLGFNGSGSLFVSSRFKVGDPASAKKLNELSAAVQTALPQPYLGEGNQVSFTGGGSLVLNNNAGLKSRYSQFACVIETAVVDSVVEYRLKTVKGELPYSYAVTDLGIIDSIQPLFYSIDKFNLYPTGSKVTGSITNSVFLNQNGYIKLTPGNDYVVFLYILGPKYQPDGSDEAEFNVPQLGVSKIGDLPEQIIDSGNTYGRTYEINTQLVIDVVSSITYLFANTYSVRANIATIKWDSASSAFKVNQITNTPNLNYTPFIAGATSLNPTFNFHAVDAIVNGFTGYTKDLNEDVIGYTVVIQGEL